MVGKMRPGYDNIHELRVLHSWCNDLWEASERVAIRLNKSDFNSIKHWRTLESISTATPFEKVWNSLSLFLVSCSDEMFKRFFDHIQNNNIDLGKLLLILHNNNSSGDKIFAFIFNITPVINRKKKEIEEINKKLKVLLKSDPNIDLIKIGILYQKPLGNSRNAFNSFDEWESFFKSY